MSDETTIDRRKFLKSATIVGGAVVGAAPMVSVAQSPITFRWQSTWPAKDIFHEYALDYAKKVNDMSGAPQDRRAAVRRRGQGV